MVGVMSMAPVHMAHGGAELRMVGIVISFHTAGMYALSPVFGCLADRHGRIPVLAGGAAVLAVAFLVAGTAGPHDVTMLSFGLFLLGLGWSASLVSGSALLVDAVPPADRPGVQGRADLAVNLSGALGGSLAGLTMAATSYAVLNALAASLAADRPGRGPAGRPGRDPIAGFEPDRRPPYRAGMRLLERESALADLGAALAAARAGRGRVALLSGGAGMGKTSVVRTFLAGLDAGTRVLEGACDDLLTPRPFGPVHDMSRSARPALARALAEGAAQSIFTALLDELTDERAVRRRCWSSRTCTGPTTPASTRWPSSPAASRDSARCWCSPIATTRCRWSSLLQRVLGGLRAPVAVRIPLGPLSARAVTQLAGEPGAGLRVYASTGGNPFFVTELLAAEQEGLPASVSQAVLARVARLPEPTRALLDLLAVVPARAETGLLDEVCPDWPEAAAAAEERGVVAVHGGALAFRHELARRAVEEAMPRSRARRLHARVLARVTGPRRRSGAAGASRRTGRRRRHPHRGGAARRPGRGRRRRPPGGRRALPPGAAAGRSLRRGRAGRPARGVHRRGVDDVPDRRGHAGGGARARPPGGAGRPLRGGSEPALDELAGLAERPAGGHGAPADRGAGGARGPATGPGPGDGLQRPGRADRALRRTA